MSVRYPINLQAPSSFYPVFQSVWLVKSRVNVKSYHCLAQSINVLVSFNSRVSYEDFELETIETLKLAF